MGARMLRAPEMMKIKVSRLTQIPASGKIFRGQELTRAHWDFALGVRGKVETASTHVTTPELGLPYQEYGREGDRTVLQRES